MSSGQRPRTREHFPKMKIRGRRRKSRQASELAAIVERFSEELKRIAAAASIALSGFQSGVLAVGRALRAEVERAFAYVGSERFILDGLASQHQGDPIAHSDAVADYFTRRSRRELDELLARVSGKRSMPIEWNGQSR